jgi:solute carrier family 25 (mitochondrial oxoglutarate transporter), member 11
LNSTWQQLLEAVTEAQVRVEEKPHTMLDHPIAKRLRPFVVGGSSGMIATCCIQPIDMIKVRLQLHESGVRTTPFSVARNIIAKGSVLDLYNGLSAGLLRQVVYGTSRLGFFFTFEELLKQRAAEKGSTYGFSQRALASLTAGGLGAFIGNPVEVALIRMQSDGLRPRAEQARYRSVFDALGRVGRSEGVLALWSGSYPSVVRAKATNLGQLAFFSETKAQLQKRTDVSHQTRSVIASGVAGFFASLLSLPFDFVKTRLQRQTRRADGTVQYKGVLDCFRKVAKEEGFIFYRGFGTYILRIAPHS